MADGVNYEPKELFNRIDSRFDELTKKIDATFAALNSEIRDVRHRVANLEAGKELQSYTLQDLRASLSKVENAQSPMVAFLQEQAGVDKWKKRAMAFVGLFVAAVGVLTGFIIGS